MSDTIYINSPNTMLDDTITITGAVGATSSALDIDWGVSPSYVFSNTGAAGQVYTTTGTGAASWATITSDPNLQGATLHVKGDAEFEGDLKIKGKSINDSLERIEDRLAILRPNEELEAKWENLRGLRKAYMELEAEIIEKEKMWGILKR
jgi:hypothetical protein